MFNEKQRTVSLGLAFLALLMFSYIANTTFFNSLSFLFQNQLLVFALIFMNNIIVISLIYLGMRFYVDLVVLGFFKKEKHAFVVIDHSRIFAVLFTFIVLFLSILRGANLFFGKIVLDELPTILLVSTPIGIIEGFGIYLTIWKTLNRTITTKDLLYIYGIFLAAALIEIGFINLIA